MNQNERKQRKHLPLSAYFSYLLVATLLLTGVTFSKYYTEVSTEDSARVAAVAISGVETTQADTITIDKPNNQTTASYQFQITNTKDSKTSEVSLSYTVTVQLPKALPQGVSMKLVNGSSEYTATPSNSGKTYTFSNQSFTFPAGTSTTHNYVLKFIGSDTLATSDTLTGISVSVSAEQIN